MVQMLLPWSDSDLELGLAMLSCCDSGMSVAGMKQDLLVPRMEQAFLQPGGRLEEVVMEDWIVDRLTPKLPSMELTSHAVFSLVETDIPGHKDTLLIFLCML